MKRFLTIVSCLLVIVFVGIGESPAAEKKSGAKQTWSAKASAQDYEIGAGDIL